MVISYINNYSIRVDLDTLLVLTTRIIICLRGLGAYATLENFENMVQFGAFWSIF